MVIRTITAILLKCPKYVLCLPTLMIRDSCLSHWPIYAEPNCMCKIVLYKEYCMCLPIYLEEDWITCTILTFALLSHSCFLKAVQRTYVDIKK